MSGHSKWSNIKRKKEANDKVKGNRFGKLSRLITAAVIEGGGLTDPDNNVKLRLVIDKAKQENMPKDSILRAIEKGSGPDKNLHKEVVYEAFGPNGVALVIIGTTDNTNRTLGEMRSVLERHGGKLGQQGSVSYLFQKCGRVVVSLNKVTEDQAFSYSEKISAYDVEESEASFIIYFPYEKLSQVATAIKDLSPEAVPEIVYRPISKIEIPSETEAQKLMTLIEALEELEDIHKVYTNTELS